MNDQGAHGNRFANKNPTAPLPQGLELTTSTAFIVPICLAARKRGRDAMVTIDDLVANWIEMRATIKQQLEHFKSGNKMRVPGMDSEEATAEAVDRLEKCLAEIETLLRHYPARD